MAHRLEGWTAIQYAEKHGGTLKKFADPTERALKRVSIDKAKKIAREDSRLIYMDVKHGNQSNPAKRVNAYSAKRGGHVEYEVFGKDEDETGGQWVSRGAFGSRADASREVSLLRGFGWQTKIRQRSARLNPSLNSVSLRNFTGTITKNSNGTVSIKGRKK